MKALRVLAAATLAALSWSAHAVGHLADISLYDRASGRELPVYWRDGQAYVVGQPGNEYQVVVRNRAREDLLGVVSVDGVNVLSGETATSDQSGYVVSRGEKLDIRGWRKSLGEIAAFYFTSLGDSYAARTGRPDNVGVIGVALFKRKYTPPPIFSQVAPYETDAWRKREAEPAPRLQAPAAPPFGYDNAAPSGSAAPPEASRAESKADRYAQPSAPLGTGHGRREESQARYVQFERATRDPVETITIRYDSYRNLVAMGVLPVPAEPRTPRAFPGFVADPPA